MDSERPNAVCQECGHEQEQGGVIGTCPECGCTSVGMSFRISTKVGVQGRADATHVSTTRTARVMDTTQRLPYEDAKQLQRVLVASDGPAGWDELAVNDRVAQQLASELENAVTTGLWRDLYRAQGFESRPADLPPSRFFRPPANKASIGRFNPAGDSVMYLAESAELAAAEVSRHYRHAHTFAQKFSVANPSVKWVPFAPDLESEAPLLNAFLMLAEQAPSESETTEAYLPSHFLRFLAERAGAQGIAYPSVRSAINGQLEAGGQNMVLFGTCLDGIEHAAAGEPLEVERASMDG